jgi:hypothetical protein
MAPCARAARCRTIGTQLPFGTKGGYAVARWLRGEPGDRFTLEDASTERSRVQSLYPVIETRTVCFPGASVSVAGASPTNLALT